MFTLPFLRSVTSNAFLKWLLVIAAIALLALHKG
jgi:hypothetical protein